MIGYSNWQSPLWRDESRFTKHLDIPLYGRFEVLSPFSVNGLRQVEYVSNGKPLVGFIEDRFMEYYVQWLPYDLVDMGGLQTPEPNDPQQNIILDGKKRVNMCGQMCVSYVIDKPLDEIFNVWRVKDVPFYKRVMGASGTTGNYDLIKLLGLFGRTASPLTIKKYTPRLLSELVQNTTGLIVSVHLNTQNGSLVGAKVLH